MKPPTLIKLALVSFILGTVAVGLAKLFTAHVHKVNVQTSYQPLNFSLPTFCSQTPYFTYVHPNSNQISRSPVCIHTQPAVKYHDGVSIVTSTTEEYYECRDNSPWRPSVCEDLAVSAVDCTTVKSLRECAQNHAGVSVAAVCCATCKALRLPTAFTQAVTQSVQCTDAPELLPSPLTCAEADCSDRFSRLACCKTCRLDLRRRLHARHLQNQITCQDVWDADLLESYGYIEGSCVREIGWMYQIFVTCDDFPVNEFSPGTQCCGSCSTLWGADQSREAAGNSPPEDTCVNYEDFQTERYGHADCNTYVQSWLNQGYTCDTQNGLYPPRLVCCDSCTSLDPQTTGTPTVVTMEPTTRQPTLEPTTREPTTATPTTRAPTTLQPTQATEEPTPGPVCVDSDRVMSEYSGCADAVWTVVFVNGETCETTVGGQPLTDVCCASCTAVQETCTDLEDLFGQLCSYAVTTALLEGNSCSTVEPYTGVTLEDLCCVSCASTSLTCANYDFYISDTYDSCEQAVTSFFEQGKTCDEPVGSAVLGDVCCLACGTVDDCVDMDVSSYDRSYTSCLDAYVQFQTQGWTCDREITTESGVSTPLTDLCCDTCATQDSLCADYPDYLTVYASCSEAFAALGDCSAVYDPNLPATLDSICCATCSMEEYEPQCLDNELFLEEYYDDCTHAIVEYRSEGRTCSDSLPNGVILGDACCASCSPSDDTDICVDYSTFIQAYYASCTVALEVQACDELLPDSDVTVESVCCASCTAVVPVETVCVDYDSFVIGYSSCAEAVAQADSCEDYMGNATLANTCCASCAQQDLCVDYDTFITGRGYSSCSAALHSLNYNCSELIEDVPLSEICCSSCSNAYCEDYPTFITPYYSSCLNALTANGGNCAATISVPDNISEVLLSDVCCSSCSVWEAYSDTCVDYDQFLFHEQYVTCAEAVSDLLASGRSCDSPVGSGTFRGVCCESCSKVEETSSSCVDTTSARLCEFGYNDCTAAVEALRSQGFTSCALFPEVESTCCLSCSTFYDEEASCSSRRHLTDDGDSQDHCTDDVALISRFTQYSTCIELLDAHELDCADFVGPVRISELCCVTCSRRVPPPTPSPQCIPRSNPSHTRDTLMVFDTQQFLVHVHPEIKRDFFYQGFEVRNRVYDSNNVKVFEELFGAMNFSLARVAEWTGLDLETVSERDSGRYPLWGTGVHLHLDYHTTFLPPGVYFIDWFWSAPTDQGLIQETDIQTSETSQVRRTSRGLRLSVSNSGAQTPSVGIIATMTGTSLILLFMFLLPNK